MSAPLHHLALRTTDVEALVAFYRDLFDLPVVRDQRPRSMWLGLGDGAVLMIEHREDGEPGPAAGSMELFALRVDGPTRDAIRTRSRERGCYDGETGFTVYVRDPDGRRVGASTFDLATGAD